MSRIGRLPIQIPKGVTVTLAGGKVTIKGPKGQLELVNRPEVAIESRDNVITVSSRADGLDRQAGAYHGMTRALLQNMITGVTQGYEKKLEINGVGYNAKIQGKEVILAMGFSHPVKVAIPTGIQVECPQPTQILIRGCDRQAVGELAARIRKIRKPEPYKGKGIKYDTETIRRKAGKAFGSA
ncbi:MAG: 50S ribosomal protein L6 [Planctomycetes bacterium]|nr:50S ribosomal protein L6 [Planctomycetota bacterium]